MSSLNMLAFDLGASNGRAVLGQFDGERLILQELHRFENTLVETKGLLYWNYNRLVAELQEGFSAYRRLYEGTLSSFGIDSWAVDYGLLDRNGRLLGNPRAYRNGKDEEMKAAWELVPKKELFSHTGIAAMNFNTAYQLVRRQMEKNENLSCAKTMLMIPDLLGHFFTGDICTEFTNATTTNLLNAHTHKWDMDIIRRLGLPEGIFTSIDMAGSLRSPMKPALREELDVGEAVRLVAVGTHDTASAVAAIPSTGDFAFCSSGTWSLVGVETEKPIINDTVYEGNFSNEGTVQGGYRPLKNIMGLWLIQECRREWQREGRNFTWDEIAHMAEVSTPLKSIIDPDYPDFFAPGNMQQKICRYCTDTKQPLPETEGEMARCVYESLALKYRHALQILQKIKGKPLNSFNMVGGGVQNKLLCQMVADATGVYVIAGPIEGACVGNLLMQAVALGEIESLTKAREVVMRSFSLDYYEPNNTAAWQDGYGRLLKYMEKKKY